MTKEINFYLMSGIYDKKMNFLGQTNCLPGQTNCHEFENFNGRDHKGRVHNNMKFSQNLGFYSLKL